MSITGLKFESCPAAFYELWGGVTDGKIHDPGNKDGALSSEQEYCISAGFMGSKMQFKATEKIDFIEEINFWNFPSRFLKSSLYVISFS